MKFESVRRRLLPALLGLIAIVASFPGESVASGCDLACRRCKCVTTTNVCDCLKCTIVCPT
jgi:hypothetical protein